MCLATVAGCRLVRNGCRSVWCPTCGPVQGARLRERLIQRFKEREVSMVGFATLTCSPAVLGDDLEGQFLAVKDGRLVSRFVRLFRQVTGKDGSYLSVMEFHKKSGQVHFHVVLDGGGRLTREALVELQAWCQQHMGTFDYKYMASERAIRYCLKYITKGAYDGLPAWCLDFEGRIRPYTASHGFWHDGKPRKVSEPTGVKRAQRTLRVRIERCKDAGVIGLSESVTDDGEIVRRYSFYWSLAFEKVRELAAEVVQDASEREKVRTAKRGFWLSVGELQDLARRVFEGPSLADRIAGCRRRGRDSGDAGSRSGP